MTETDFTFIYFGLILSVSVVISIYAGYKFGYHDAMEHVIKNLHVSD